VVKNTGEFVQEFSYDLLHHIRNNHLWNSKNIILIIPIVFTLTVYQRHLIMVTVI
jgi:hypothetical protein